MREKLGEILCPNCQTKLSIWQAKSGSGFVSCGLCGFRGFNIHIKGPEGEQITDTILDREAFRGENKKELDWVKE